MQRAWSGGRLAAVGVAVAFALSPAAAWACTGDGGSHGALQTHCECGLPDPGAHDPVAAAVTAAPVNAALVVPVSMIGSQFVPSLLTVTEGDTVMWQNVDPVFHTVTSDTGVFDSGFVGPQGAYEFTFSSPGTYDYTCILHFGMDGRIVVTAIPEPALGVPVVAGLAVAMLRRRRQGARGR